MPSTKRVTKLRLHCNYLDGFIKKIVNFVLKPCHTASYDIFTALCRNTYTIDALYDHHVRRSMQYKTANDFEWAASTVHSSTNSSVNTQSHIWCWSSGSPGSSTPPPWKNYSQPSGQMPQSSWIQPADLLFTQRPWNECMDCFQGFCLPYVTNTLKFLLPLKY